MTPPPTPLQFLVSLAWGAGLGLSLIAISGGANRIAKRAAGYRAHVARFVGYSTLGLGAAWLALLGLSLVYPHHHHDVEWFDSRRSLNYTVDAALGIANWNAAWLVYRLGWKRPVVAVAT